MAKNEKAAATPPQPQVSPDIQERIDKFNKELLPLLGKFELGLGAEAGLTPDGRVFARPIIVDVRGRADINQTTEQAAGGSTLAKPE